MTLCRVLKPLGTRNKNRITQPTEKIILKNYYILHKLHDHKFINQSLKAYCWQISSRKHVIYFAADSSGVDPISFQPWVWHSSVQSQSNFRGPVSYYMCVFAHSALRNPECKGVNIPKGISHLRGDESW